MEEIRSTEERAQGSKYLSMCFIIFGVFICWGALAQAIIMWASTQLFGKNMLDLVAEGGVENASDQAALMVNLFLNSVLCFGGSALIIMAIYRKKAPITFFSGLRVVIDLKLIGLLVVFVLFSAVGLGVFIEMAEQLARILPEEFVDEARKTQEAYSLSAEQLAVGGVGYFALNVMAVAVAPAICEELYFRGVMLPAIAGATGKKHSAVILTGIIFSLFHFQFFNLFAITAIGIALGYLYVWTRSILVPVVAHFLNNFFTILSHYVYYTQKTGVLSPSYTPPFWSSLIAVGLAAVVFYLIYKHVKSREVYH